MVPTEPLDREALVFAHGEVLYAVDAVRVDAVIPWRDPMPLPGVDAAIQGVIQDRGRVVTVLGDPEGRRDPPPAARPARIVVCTTRRGLIGLPASATRAVGPVGEETLTWIDPDALLSAFLGEARP